MAGSWIRLEDGPRYDAAELSIHTDPITAVVSEDDGEQISRFNGRKVRLEWFDGDTESSAEVMVMNGQPDGHGQTAVRFGLPL